MTSTVLDVTVFLLCVSASVGTLLGGVPVSPGDTPDAQAIADRIATETGTVNFTVSGVNGPEDRRAAGTLAELLANAVVSPPASESSIGGDSYRTAVADLVAKRIGSRVRVIARAEARKGDVTVGPAPPPNADVAVAAFSVPVEGKPEYVRIVVQRWSHE